MFLLLVFFLLVFSCGGVFLLVFVSSGGFLLVVFFPARVFFYSRACFSFAGFFLWVVFVWGLGVVFYLIALFSLGVFSLVVCVSSGGCFFGWFYFC